ncbi:MAG: methane monooxygenase/ammonia monooxygenase subunit C [Pseudomonadales bacterium]|nr:methane monooxygenase/ammonia monooxygenase subunit C [Pseudomonadales bacterium]
MLSSTRDMTPPWKLIISVFTAIMSVFIVYRIYQHKMAFTVGLDYFEPEFQIYWMNLLYIQLTVLCIGGTALLAWIWFTREKELVLEISREEEVFRYFKLLGLFTVFAVITWVSASLYTEADAAWHQVTVRDTDFTPTHIPLFYFGIPVMIIFGFALFTWGHTRLPDFYHRISLPFAIAIGGPLLIMPNLGYNEWGHTFFYAEELFAAPIHWGFVVLGWAIFFVGGFILQMLRRLDVLINGTDEEAKADLVAQPS